MCLSSCTLHNRTEDGCVLVTVSFTIGLRIYVLVAMSFTGLKVYVS